MNTATATSRAVRRISALGALLVLCTVGFASVSTSAGAASPPAVNLGSAAAASVLAGTGVTNTGPSALGLDVDTSPSPAIVGFPPGTTTGTIHAADAVAQKAQADLTTAYNVATNKIAHRFITMASNTTNSRYTNAIAQ